MNQRASSVFILLAVFLATFLSVFFLKSTERGKQWIQRITGKEEVNGFKEEVYHLQNKPSIDLTQVEVLQAINRESAALVKSVIPSVVSIDTSGVQHQRLQDVFGRTWVQPRAVQGQGSGVVVTLEGHVLTNYHVVQGEPAIQITMHDGSKHEARVVGADPAVDIAVLKIIDRGPFIPLKFGDSSQLEVGNTVYAVGSPFGLGESVTNGMISAKKRSFSDSQVDLLQTSAAINPGNSGGPLVNIAGEIVGINSRIYSTDKENPGFQGIGFAIPSNDALKTMKDILARGRPIRGYLGIALEDLSPSAKRVLGFPGSGGVRVARIMPHSPAMKAGLLENDIIMTFANEDALVSRRLISLIQQSEVGSEVKLRVWRDQEEVLLTSIIGEADDYTPSLIEGSQALDTKTLLSAIGLYVRDLTASERSEGLRGVAVSRISEASNLQGELQVGDIIRAINGNLAINSESFLTELARSAATQETELFVIRGKERLRVHISQVK